MSYPRTINALIVEDEQDAKESYAQIFRRLANEFNLAPPTYARSYEEGAKRLEGTDIFQLVILDLNLPMKDKEHPTEDDLGYGLGLANVAAHRDHCPIPVILVISGYLNKTKLARLNDLFITHFWHGCPVNKGMGDEEEEIRKAIQYSLEYCDVGIHIRQSEQVVCPAISPREEDLLRRCILKQDCIGADLEWWSGDYVYVDEVSGRRKKWTKVLMGRFILKDGLGLSHPTFFKFEPSFSNAYDPMHDVKIMQQKLPHIKICCSLAATSESLLVTQKVGASTEAPISLSRYLATKIDDADNVIPSLINDVLQQLHQLGETSPDRVPISSLFWPSHDKDRIKKMWEMFEGANLMQEFGLRQTPDESLLVALSNHALVWIKSSPCTHGDLNPTNIAIDADTDRMRAYIFDAAGIHSNTNVHDIAYLEITSLLHQPQPDGNSLVRTCAGAFGETLGLSDTLVLTSDGEATRNTLLLIKRIREQALALAEPHLYALALLDCALMQLGGLDFGVSNNHIHNPEDAAVLVALILRWIEKIAPQLMTVC